MSHVSLLTILQKDINHLIQSVLGRDDLNNIYHLQTYFQALNDLSEKKLLDM